MPEMDELIARIDAAYAEFDAAVPHSMLRDRAGRAVALLIGELTGYAWAARNEIGRK